MWTFRLRIFKCLNLRDSDAEDNVCKRPFTTKVNPIEPFGLIESATNLGSFFEPTKYFERKIKMDGVKNKLHDLQ